jgi:hypothetical protein
MVIMLIKQIAGRVASELLFYLGHAIHYPMIWFDWAWIHPAYDRLMTWSHQTQIWAGNTGPWKKVDINE